MATILSACGSKTLDDGEGSETGTDPTTATMQTGTGASGTSGGSTGTATGRPCTEPSDCSATEYCDFPANSCGEQSYDTGQCTARPEGCDGSYEPVCGCDGATHSNACTAASAGTDVAAAGGCEAPPEYFPCGEKFCAEGIHYCETIKSDVAGSPDAFQCKALPEDCSSCDCLTEPPCGGSSCEEKQGNLYLTCPGG